MTTHPRLLPALTALILTLTIPALADIVSVGDFTRIYDPSAGMDKKWYINDHCFDEDNLAHATAKTLTQPQWQKQPFALTIDPAFEEEHLWAPHIILHKDTYYMYYCAGDKDHSKYKIHLATSKDLWTWTRHRENPMIVDGYDARDPFVLTLGKKWVMYYTATTEPKGGNHIVASQTSSDLIHWSNKKTVFTDPSKGTYGGPTESPFVVRRGRYYYLFIGPRGGYVGTDIYRSTDPFEWTPADKVAHFNSHAAEVVRDEHGKWFVTHCGWGKGGVHIAPLTWNDNLKNPKTSLSPVFTP